MTGPADQLSVPVQWALHGKKSDDGYHVLSCSTGDLSRANFVEVIGRFTKLHELVPSSRCDGQEVRADITRMIRDRARRQPGEGRARS